MHTEDLANGECLFEEEGKMKGLEKLTFTPAKRHPGMPINPSTPSAVERFAV
jgi:hypothetical protein